MSPPTVTRAKEPTLCATERASVATKANDSATQHNNRKAHMMVIRNANFLDQIEEIKSRTSNNIKPIGNTDREEEVNENDS